jgi:hypothetical protein
MRNDARPIGEAFRDIAEHECRERTERAPESRAPDEQPRVGNKPFVTNRDPGDEELPPGVSDR